MKLYISSYKLGDRTDELKNWIYENSDNKIVLMPNALDIYQDGDRKQQRIENEVRELEQLGFQVRVLSLKDYFGKKEKLIEDLKDFHAFFAIGGNVFVLRQAMRLSGFDDYLRELSKKDGYLYGGYSAGICLLAPSLSGLELVDNHNENVYGIETIWDGIGIKFNEIDKNFMRLLKH